MYKGYTPGQKPAVTNFYGFYILGCGFVKSWPILDFLVSADSQDLEDFKNVLKMPKQGQTKAVRPWKVCAPN